MCEAGPLVATINRQTGAAPNVIYEVTLWNAEGVNINSEIVSKSHAWVSPVSSVSVDPNNFDQFAEEQDHFGKCDK